MVLTTCSSGSEAEVLESYCMRRQIELAFKQLVTAPPEIIRALLSGEISVHRAWLCIGESPEKQIEKFRHYQITSEIRKTIRACLSQHVPAAPSTLPDL